jgi:hypothetical protein
MTALNSLHRAVLPSIMALALLTSASQAQQAYPTPEDAVAASGRCGQERDKDCHPEGARQ